MKNLKNRILGIGLALLSGAGAFYGLNKIKSEIYAYHKLVHDYNSLQTEYENYDRSVKQRVGCNCPPKIGLEENPLKLIGSYDYNNDDNLDCVYQDPKTKKTYLYESGDGGHGLSLIGEVNFPNKLYKQKAKQSYSIIKKQRDKEFEEIKKGVIEEFNK